MNSSGASETMKFAGAVTLRPIRLGFLLPSDDVALVRRAARLCSCLWGGRYNPIIPFFEDVHPRRIASYLRGEGVDVARGYIDFFEPDVLVEATAGMAARLGWSNDGRYFRLPRVIPLDEFYEVDSRGSAEFAAGIDIINVIKHLYDREYKYQLRHRIPYAMVEAGHDDAFFDVFPGAFPADEAWRISLTRIVMCSSPRSWRLAPRRRSGSSTKDLPGRYGSRSMASRRVWGDEVSTN
jgi:hypothetical protein